MPRRARVALPRLAQSPPEAATRSSAAHAGRPAPDVARKRAVMASGRAAPSYGAPKTYEDLRAVLASDAMRMPKRLRQVATFLWQHPTEIALGTIGNVAGKAGVQPSTLVRFAQTLGYSGFSDLQALFKEYLKGARAEERGHALQRGDATDPYLHMVVGLIDASRQSLSRALDSIESARVAAVVHTLAEADMIYLVGSKRAFPVTTYLSLALAQLGVPNILVDNVGSTAFGQIGCTRSSDAVLAISFSPYNSITPDLVTLAAQRGTPVVSITDSSFSPLVPISRAWIEVIESDFGGFRSIAATMAVGMAVVVNVAKLRNARPPAAPDAR
jgi:DNA-binding MurR/RpiR family transcriptional regulator